MIKSDTFAAVKEFLNARLRPAGNETVFYMETDSALTRREREVLDLIGQGKTSKQIASTLNLSVYTVNNHRKHICKKLGLHSTAQLVAFAVTQSAVARAGAA